MENPNGKLKELQNEVLATWISLVSKMEFITLENAKLKDENSILNERVKELEDQMKIKEVQNGKS